MPELQQLSQLVAIAKAGTITKAAETLHISQPSLTRTIQKLEAEWNVKLFDHQKNRVQLNKTGELAVQYAQHILDEVAQMTQAVQTFDRSQRTISIGSCAPMPTLELVCRLQNRFAGMSLVSETVPLQTLLPRLEQEHDQIIILDHFVDAPNLICQEFCTEQLFLTVPPEHPLAARSEGIYAEELAGTTMLLYYNLGIWQNFHDTKMRRTEFIVQERDDAFDALLRSSSLLAFATNLSIRYMDRKKGRIVIPLLDKEAKITFYCCVLKKNRAYLP